VNRKFSFPGPQLLILTGSCVFVFVLALSAYLEPDIRRLHFFQAWMYVAAVGLSFRRSRWGYFIGLSAAGLWDYLNVFVTTFFRSGLHWLSVSIGSGRFERVDQIVAVPGWLGNLLVVIGCIWGYVQLREKGPGDLARFAIACSLTTGFFAAIMAICQPRYLPLFGRLLHPHAPW